MLYFHLHNFIIIFIVYMVLLHILLWGLVGNLNETSCFEYLKKKLMQISANMAEQRNNLKSKILKKWCIFLDSVSKLLFHVGEWCLMNIICLSTCYMNVEMMTIFHWTPPRIDFFCPICSKRINYRNTNCYFSMSICFFYYNYHQF